MSQRLSQLMKMLEREPRDPFLLYGIALEHKKAGDGASAVAWLDRALEADGLYCYAYFQKGQVLEEAGRAEEARAVYTAGIEAARRKGDGHAASELEGALAMLG